MFVFVKLISLFDIEMEVYQASQVLNQCININTIYSNLETRNRTYYLGAWAKIETVIENPVCQIVGHCYYRFQALSQ